VKKEEDWRLNWRTRAMAKQTAGRRRGSKLQEMYKKHFRTYIWHLGLIGDREDKPKAWSRF
jgi:hypothetical protein